MLQINQSHPDLTEKLNSYPPEVRQQMLDLRSLILETADELGLGSIEETLKWGEPSYIAKHGSTLRMDWKPRNPDQYALYFKCTSKIVPSIRASFGDLFTYEKNRAILFQLSESLPIQAVKACIAAALQYHQRKHLPNLGILDLSI